VVSDEGKIGEALLAQRDTDRMFWDWLLPDVSPSMKDANKFLLGCILDYQMRAEQAWSNARRLAEGILADPDDLWDAITTGSLAAWNAKRKEYALHRFPKGHERVYTIGKRIVS